MMRQTTSQGYTIVEVVLFLAVTGLMVAGVLATVSQSINRQRYQDAVSSLYDFMQGQYNTVDNVRTNRTEAACTAAGINTGGSQARGTSDCSIVGRFIISEDGRTIDSRPLYATADITLLTGVDDEDDLINELGLVVAPDDMTDDTDEYQLSWQTSLYTNPGASIDSFSLVLLKLPTNGLVRAYAASPARSGVDDTIAQARTDNSSLTICIDPDVLTSAPPIGVRVLPMATNTGGVQRITGGSGECS